MGIPVHRTQRLSLAGFSIPYFIFDVCLFNCRVSWHGRVWTCLV